jgi:hypothetical protein
MYKKFTTQTHVSYASDESQPCPDCGRIGIEFSRSGPAARTQSRLTPENTGCVRKNETEIFFQTSIFNNLAEIQKTRFYKNVAISYKNNTINFLVLFKFCFLKKVAQKITFFHPRNPITPRLLT